ncbi:MAG: helix-turn-helix transcriptional regulator [Bacteroidales bacterium]|nr:helix-turn-helix transcriptional regulator [Bacteroidales bacterium]
MKTHTIDEVQDQLIGRVGTVERDRFEYELQVEMIGQVIKQTRRERNMTQADLGQLLGVKKSQISRLESNASNITIGNLLRIFSALQAKVKIHVELPQLEIEI